MFNSLEKDAEARFDAMSKEEKEAARLELAKEKYADKEDVKIEDDKIMYKENGEWKEGESFTEAEAKQQYADKAATEEMAAAVKELPKIMR
jgi:hypothetical protein